MKPKNNIVYLKKYTPFAKSIMYEAQVIADELRHQITTLDHFCISIRSFIFSEEVLSSFNPKYKRIIDPIFVKKFNTLTSTKKELERLSQLPKALEPKSACFSQQMFCLMSFAEDNKKVNVLTLMTELFNVLN